MEYFVWMAGSLPFIILGSIHLIYTCFTDKFSPRNPVIEKEMKVSSPVLTEETTMWKAWIGFNASHSLGAIYFGLTNFFLACNYSPVLYSPFFVLLNFGTVVFYFWLAIKYWFSVPLTGIFIALVLFTISVVMVLTR